jgi:hypothetical protein
VRLIGHIGDAPQFVTEDGTTYMLFHLREVEGTEFRLKLLPTTPKRHQGDCVEVFYTTAEPGRALVESMTAVTDPVTTRRRNEEYLKRIAASENGESRGKSGSGRGAA